MTILDKFEGTNSVVHYGVKGMKWGIRKDSYLSRRSEAKFKKKAYSTKTYVRVYNATAKKMNDGELKKLNDKYTGKNLKDKKVWDSYISEHKRNFEKIANEVLAGELGGSRSSKSGKTKVRVVMNEETGYMAIVPHDYVMKHSEPFESMGLKLLFDEDRFIIGVRFEKNIANQQLTHEEIFGDESTFLAHYGIRGMKWGVRKDDSSSTKSDLSSKSDEQLRKEVKRMQLERQYKQLKSEKVSNDKIELGKKKALQIIGNAAQESTKNYLTKQFGKAIEFAVDAAVDKVLK